MRRGSVASSGFVEDLAGGCDVFVSPTAVTYFASIVFLASFFLSHTNLNLPLLKSILFVSSFSIAAVSALVELDVSLEGELLVSPSWSS